MLALGIIIPVLPKLVLQLSGGSTAHAAHIVGLFGKAWALMQFACSPLAGALSDRFGRRPVILLSNLGLGLDYVLMATGPTLSWLFAGRLISGVTSASIGAAGGVRRRCLAARKARQGLWHARRRVWARIRVGAGGRRVTRQCVSAFAVLGRSRGYGALVFRRRARDGALGAGGARSARASRAGVGPTEQGKLQG
jgi:MFS family permease